MAFASVLLGDDCIAINSGSSYINISGIACGPGHGIRYGGFPFSFILVIKKRQKSISHKTLKLRFLLFSLAFVALEALGKMEVMTQ